MIRLTVETDNGAVEAVLSALRPFDLNRIEQIEALTAATRWLKAADDLQYIAPTYGECRAELLLDGTPVPVS